MYAAFRTRCQLGTNSYLEHIQSHCTTLHYTQHFTYKLHCTAIYTIHIQCILHFTHTLHTAMHYIARCTLYRALYFTHTLHSTSDIHCTSHCTTLHTALYYIYYTPEVSYILPTNSRESILFRRRCTYFPFPLQQEELGPYNDIRTPPPISRVPIKITRHTSCFVAIELDKQSGELLRTRVPALVRPTPRGSCHLTYRHSGFNSICILVI